MIKTLSILLGVGLMVGALASQASAIEMFTNFNDGMEIGYRPLGYPAFPPVRFHAWQPEGWYIRHGMCRPSGFEQSPAPSPPNVVPPVNVPNQWQTGALELHGAPVAGAAPRRRFNRITKTLIGFAAAASCRSARRTNREAFALSSPDPIFPQNRIQAFARCCR